MAETLFIGKISIEGGPPQDFLAKGEAQALVIWGGPPLYPDISPPMPQPPPGAHPAPPIYYPPVIWPPPGHPAHPIAPGGPPPHVEHPIPPVIWPGPTPPGETPPPTDSWRWAYDEELGWVLVPPGGGGKPQPTP